MRTVYIVRLAENDFKSQILGDQYATWNCEHWRWKYTNRRRIFTRQI